MLSFIFKGRKAKKTAQITHLRYWAPTKQWSIRVEVGKEWIQPNIDREFARFLLTQFANKGMADAMQFDEEELILSLKNG